MEVNQMSHRHHFRRHSFRRHGFSPFPFLFLPLIFLTFFVGMGVLFKVWVMVFIIGMFMKLFFGFHRRHWHYHMHHDSDEMHDHMDKMHAKMHAKWEEFQGQHGSYDMSAEEAVKKA